MWAAITMCLPAVAQQKNEVLPPTAFHATLEKSDAQLIDVRTPEEFNKQHLAGAVNIDINSSDFKTRVVSLDKSRPVMVYCLSGGRSAKAASYLQQQGFKTVYDLQGGILQWNAEKKPTVATGAKGTGMTLLQFQELTRSGLVLVDFFATWCGPCKIMAPRLEAVSSKYSSKLSLLKIDADANSALLDNLHVAALPTFYLFKNGKQVWSHTGLVDQRKLEDIVAAHAQ